MPQASCTGHRIISCRTGRGTQKLHGRNGYAGRSGMCSSRWRGRPVPLECRPVNQSHRVITAQHFRRRRWVRAALLLTGILLPQALLYGPSLIGRKLLLPLDILAQPGHYLPPAIAQRVGQPQDWVLSDLVLQEEVFRRYAVERVRSGHLPLWNPYILCGVPFVAANHTAVFSPFRWLDYLWPGPWVLAWDQVLRALVAGTGAYLFFRRELGAAFAPAAIGAWCF